ncbi:hypothetical protein [Bradyrhizobium sp. 930_D9_N1_4]|uniref:hypothetical protein n=1 Tax=Bradyrhizobium sp. 930_D9_N1_4 TaxID=3240374 RepID=UPI003F8CF20A
MSILRAAGGIIYTLGLILGGYVDKRIVAQCSPHECTIAVVRGFLLLGFVVFNIVVFNHIVMMLTGQFAVSYFLACTYVAVLLGLVDYWAFYIFSQYEDGLRSLADGGAALHFLAPIPRWAKIAKCTRLALGVILCLNTTMLSGVDLNQPTIARRLVIEDQTLNRAIDTRALQESDDRKQRDQTAYDTQLALVRRLTEGRAGDLQAAARTARAARLDVNTAVQEASRAYERRLSTETARLETIKTRLDKISVARTESAGAQDPHRVPKDSSLLRQLRALYWDEMSENPWLLLPLILLASGLILWDVTIQSLAAMWSPRKYAAATTREALREAVTEAKLSVCDFNGPRNDDPPPPAAPSQAQPAPPPPPEPPSMPPRRGRGRPRRNGLDTTANALGNSAPPAMNTKPV